MKIIITESQYKLLFESKLNNTMQVVINESFDIIKNNCEEEYYFDMMVCDGVEIVDEIKVIEVNKVTAKSERNNYETTFFNITVDCYIDYFKPTYDLNSFIDELVFEARGIVGGRTVNITLRDTINKRKNFDW